MHGLTKFLSVSALPLLWTSLAVFIIMMAGWWFHGVQNGFLAAFGTLGFLLSIFLGGGIVLRNCYRVRYDFRMTFAAILLFSSVAALGVWLLFADSEMQTSGQTLTWAMVPNLLACGTKVMLLPVILLSLLFSVSYVVAMRFNRRRHNGATKESGRRHEICK